MGEAERIYYTEEEYLAFVEEQETKYEFVDGYILAMTGGSPNHSQIAMNAGVALSMALRNKDCIVFNSDLKLKAAQSYFFPDCMVICGKPALDERSKNVVTNPTLIVEVLSETTESYDRGQKFMHYRQLPFLQGYLLIAQDRIHIDAFHKSDEGWALTDAISLDTAIHIPSLAIQLATSDIYNRVNFEES
ncbi:MAG: Uma2 family endonuclease [Flammeovirgaceae bacterium]